MLCTAVLSKGVLQRTLLSVMSRGGGKGQISLHMSSGGAAGHGSPHMSSEGAAAGKENQKPRNDHVDHDNCVWLYIEFASWNMSKDVQKHHDYQQLRFGTPKTYASAHFGRVNRHNGGCFVVNYGRVRYFDNASSKLLVRKFVFLGKCD